MIAARRAALLLGAYAAALVAAALVLHPIKAIGVENDDYVGMAQALLAGTLPRDPFRPLLYPLATAGVGSVVGDCFAAGKIVSALAATLLVAATFGLARQCVGRGAWLAAALTAGNGFVVVFGMQASTDMTFTALAMVALLTAVRAWRQPSASRMAAFGAAAGLAYFARYQALLLVLPAVLVIWRAGSPVPWRQRAVRAGWFAGAAVLALLPHALLTRAVFGTWFHDENWRTVEVKYAHAFAFDRIGTTDAGSVAAVLLHDPLAVAAIAGRDFVAFLRGGLAALLQGDAPVTAIGGALVVAAAIGLWRVLRRQTWPLALVLAWGVAAVVAACVLFAPTPRLLLGIVPIANLGIAAAVAAIHARHALAAHGLALVLVVTSAVHAIGAVRELQAAEPWPEVAAARALQAASAAPFRLLATYEYLATLLRPTACVWRQPPSAATSARAWCDAAVADARRDGIAFVLIGRTSCGDDAFARLLATAHPDLELRERSADVALWELRGVRLPWVASTSAEHTRGGSPGLDVRVVLRDDTPLADVALVAIRVRSPAGEAAFVPLAPSPAARHTYEARLPATDGAAATGAWHLTAVVGDRTGRFGQGDPIRFADREPK